MNTISVKAVKVTMVMPADSLPRGVLAPDGQPQPDVVLTLDAGNNLALQAKITGKSYRRALRSALPGSMALVQGELASDRRSVSKAGLSVQPPKSAPAPEFEVIKQA
jgi:hypothetical protein